VNLAHPIKAFRAPQMNQLQRFTRGVLIVGWLCLAAALAGCGPSVMAVDNEQPRLDRAAPLLQGEHVVGQTFLSRQPNLSAVEFILVAYPDQEANPDVPRRLTFHLRAGPQDGDAFACPWPARGTDEDRRAGSNVFSATSSAMPQASASGEDLATVEVNTRGLPHNSTYRFTFPPIRDSAGRRYCFFLEGTPANTVTLWSNSVDAYGEGEMWVDGVSQPGDLQFRTLYTYDAGLALGDLWRGLLTEGWLLVPAVLLFVVPGYLLKSLLLPGVAEDPVEGFALSVGLSLAINPLALLLATTLGLRYPSALQSPLGVGQPGSRGIVLEVALLLALFAAWGVWRRGLRDLRAWWRPPHRLPTLTFAAIFFTSLALRYLHIRDLVLPPWVDSVNHTFIVQIIVEQGIVPNSYEPYLPVEQFIYHFGFHTLAASFHWLTGLPVERTVLLVGQVVNALTVPATYLLARRLTGRAWAGAAAAAVPGALSLMPAYYLTWGRYTQLTGLALLPTAAALTFDLVHGQQEGLPWRRVAGAGIALAGLLLTHYRALVFFAALLAAELLVLTWSSRRWRQFWRAWARAGLACLAGGVLAFPWIARLALALLSTGAWRTWVSGSASFNAVPFDLLDVGSNRWLAVLALVGLLWAAWNRQRVAALLPLWVTILILVTNPGVVGLSSTWVLSNSSLVISSFLPLAVLIGYGFAALLEVLSRRSRLALPTLTPWLASGVLIVTSLISAWKMVQVVNPVTVLATRDDLAAMEWIRQHVPRDARFLVNARHWQEGAYVGSDGGYWLWLLTGRRTLLPPLAYVYGSPEYVRRVSADAATVAKATSLADEGLLELIRREGVTYVYLGAKGGSLSPQALLDDRRARLLFSNGAARVFVLDLNSTTLSSEDHGFLTGLSGGFYRHEED